MQAVWHSLERTDWQLLTRRQQAGRRDVDGQKKAVVLFVIDQQSLLFQEFVFNCHFPETFLVSEEEQCLDFF